MREIYAEVKPINYEDLAALARRIIKPEEVKCITRKGRTDAGALQVEEIVGAHNLRHGAKRRLF